MMEKTNAAPGFFGKLIDINASGAEDVITLPDGFSVLYKSLSSILKEFNISGLPSRDGSYMQCDRFFDDWYFYSVSSGGAEVYSLFKLREQEYELSEGINADGDDPGVTVSFISFDTDFFLSLLNDVCNENMCALNNEVNRVVAAKKQRHNKLLKDYFMNFRSKGAYLIASLYIKHLTSYFKNNELKVPEAYSIKHKNNKLERIKVFIDTVNAKAGRTVCDHNKIYIKDVDKPDEFERSIILSTHTGNTSFHSFAAEVEYHAKFLTPLAKIKIPFLGISVYDSAIRADMTVNERELTGPTPYYRETSLLVKNHIDYHKEEYFF